MARFDATVLVLSRRTYGGLLGDDFSEYSPLDLAVAWGDAALEDVYRGVSISQSGRFYYWRASGEAWDDPRVRSFGQHSANWHMVPETPEGARKLSRVRQGDVVSLQGFLVNVSGEGGKRWQTSLRRDDIGPGACEIVLVRDVRELPRSGGSAP